MRKCHRCRGPNRSPGLALTMLAVGILLACLCPKSWLLFVLALALVIVSLILCS